MSPNHVILCCTKKIMKWVSIYRENLLTGISKGEKQLLKVTQIWLKKRKKNKQTNKKNKKEEKKKKKRPKKGKEGK